MRPKFPPQTAHRFAASFLRCRELLRIFAPLGFRLVITRCSQSPSFAVIASISVAGESKPMDCRHH